MCIVVKEEPRSSSVNLIVAMDVAMSSDEFSGIVLLARWPRCIGSANAHCPGNQVAMNCNAPCCSGLSVVNNF